MKESAELNVVCNFLPLFRTLLCWCGGMGLEAIVNQRLWRMDCSVFGSMEIDGSARVDLFLLRKTYWDIHFYEIDLFEIIHR